MVQSVVLPSLKKTFSNRYFIGHKFGCLCSSPPCCTKRFRHKLTLKCWAGIKITYILLPAGPIYLCLSFLLSMLSYSYRQLLFFSFSNIYPGTWMYAASIRQYDKTAETSSWPMSCLAPFLFIFRTCAYYKCSKNLKIFIFLGLSTRVISLK